MIKIKVCTVCFYKFCQQPEGVTCFEHDAEHLFYHFHYNINEWKAGRPEYEAKYIYRDVTSYDQRGDYMKDHGARYCGCCENKISVTNHVCQKRDQAKDFIDVLRGLP